MTTPVQIIIVSGRSGSGKTSVLNILEDFGYYCLDNLPLSLLITATEKLTDSGIDKIALGVDIRTPQADLSQIGVIHDTLVARFGAEFVSVIYTTAAEHTLVARFDATRRVHPLMVSGLAQNLPSALATEIELLSPIASLADITLDTTMLNVHTLKEQMRKQLGVDNVVSVTLLSFGFKYGTPIDADFVFDVRILPNPHWQVALRQQTGQDQAVKAFFAEYPEVDEMAEDIGGMLAKWLPLFLNNNRHSVTVGIGCTGGKHRSVYIAEKVAAILGDHLPKAMPIYAKHREKVHWQKS